MRTTSPCATTSTPRSALPTRIPRCARSCSPTAAALDLVLTGRWLDARAALAAGLVGRVVARARLEATALALAGRLARLDPAAVKAVRRAVRGAHDLPLEAGVALERRLALALQGRP